MCQEKSDMVFVSFNDHYYVTYQGVDQLAAYLRNFNHKIDIQYINLDKDPINTFKNNIKHKKYKVYGFPLFYHNVEIVYKVAKYLKNVEPEAYVVVGGVFASRMYMDIFSNCNFIDYLIMGDGEVPLKELLDCVLSDKLNILENHPHIHTPKTLSVRKDMCYYDYKKFYSCNDYYQQHKGRKLMIHSTMSKSNLCSGHCTFCFERKSKNFEFKSTESLLEEIIEKYYGYGITQTRINDDNFFDPQNDKSTKQRIKKFCLDKIQRNLPITLSCCARADSLKNIPEDHELLGLMRKAGFYAIFIGAEAGNNADLKLYNKMTTVEDNYLSYSLIKQHDIYPSLGFININPYSTPDTLRQNFEFLKNIQSSRVYHYAYCFLAVYKNTPIYFKLKKDGLLKENYTYLSYLDYKFKDLNVQKVFNFLYSNFLKDKSRNQLKDAEEIAQKWHEAKVYHPNVEYLAEEINILNNELFENLIDYFEPLYVSCDTERATRQLNNFKKFLLDHHRKTILVERKILKILAKDAKIKTLTT